MILVNFQVWKIQLSIALSLVDEEYCQISTLSHLIYAFKESTNFIQKKDIDVE